MSLNPPQDYRKTEFTHRLGTAAARPAATDVLVGTLYFSTDTLVLERSNGATWASYSGGSSASSSALSKPYLFDTQSDIEPEISLPSGNTWADLNLWNDVTYSAGNFTASAGVWTVDAGDQVAYKYLMVTRTTMLMQWALNTTSVSALCTELRVQIPLGRTAKNSDILSAIRSYDNGTDTIGMCGLVAGNNYVRCWRAGFGNWAVAVNNTSVQGEAFFEVNP